MNSVSVYFSLYTPKKPPKNDKFDKNDMSLCEMTKSLWRNDKSDNINMSPGK